MNAWLNKCIKYANITNSFALARIMTRPRPLGDGKSRMRFMEQVEEIRSEISPELADLLLENYNQNPF